MDFFLREEQRIFQEIIRRDTQGYVMGEGTAEIPRQIIAKQNPGDVHRSGGDVYDLFPCFSSHRDYLGL
jgi:hypothetical protein